MSKKIGQRIHAKIRALQRYQVQLNREDLRKMIIQIKLGRVLNSRKVTNRLSEKLIIYQGNTYRLMYDHTRKNIATFLPLKVK